MPKIATLWGPVRLRDYFIAISFGIYAGLGLERFRPMVSSQVRVIASFITTCVIWWLAARAMRINDSASETEPSSPLAR